MTHTKFFSHFVFFVIFCCIGGSAHAQTLEEKLEACSKTQVSLIRLQCYDRLTQEPTASQHHLHKLLAKNLNYVEIRIKQRKQSVKNL